MPAVPKMCLGCCDVRDVAEAHITAMKSPKAPGGLLCFNIIIDGVKVTTVSNSIFLLITYTKKLHNWLRKKCKM